jgi:ribosomal protein S18 acetylase RimI-like enzyme
MNDNMIMDETLTIRSCSLHDAEAIISLGIRTFRDTFDEYNTPENMMLYLNSTFTLRRIREELQEPESVFFLAEDDDVAIGYARVRRSEVPEGLDAKAPLEIERLYVDKKYLGKRVGHHLMNTCLRHAKDHGHDLVWLGVWEHNERALAFYQKWGFEHFGQHVFMLGHDAQTDLLMKKLI